jgi:hypothetical protein
VVMPWMLGTGTLLTTKAPKPSRLVGIELLCWDPDPTFYFDKEPDSQFFNSPAGKSLNIYLLKLKIILPNTSPQHK